jgi:hypothetical protein
METMSEWFKITVKENVYEVELDYNFSKDPKYIDVYLGASDETNEVLHDFFFDEMSGMGFRFVDNGFILNIEHKDLTDETILLHKVRDMLKNYGFNFRKR